jgi:hypothetical protein
LYAAQGIPQIDTEIAEKGHFKMETREPYSFFIHPPPSTLSPS